MDIWGLIGCLTKFNVLRIWQAMILATIWLAKKKLFMFGLSNLWQFFFLSNLTC